MVDRSDGNFKQNRQLLEKRHAPTRWSFYITLFIVDPAIVVDVFALLRFLLALILAIAASPGRPGDTMQKSEMPSVVEAAHATVGSGPLTLVPMTAAI